MSIKKNTVPNIGDFTDVEVIEVLVGVGDAVAVEQPLITLESDKASMDVPAAVAGVVTEVCVKTGDRINEGDTIVLVDTAASTGSDSPAADAADTPAKDKKDADTPAADQSPPPADEPSTAEPSNVAAVEVRVPDIGDFKNVEIIEMLVAEGDRISREQSLFTLESDKATMDVPAPVAGVIEKLALKVGDKVSEGDLIALVKPATADQPSPTKTATADATPPPPAADPPPSPTQSQAAETVAPPTPPDHPAPLPPLVATPGDSKPYAGPAIRRLARQLGVDLTKVRGSGKKGRIVQDDVHQFVKQTLAKPDAASGGGFNLPPAPEVDFRAFGEVSILPLSRINKLSAAHLHRCWLTAPHVTQFADADISDLEEFRQSLAEEAKRNGYKMTPLAFFIKAAVACLRQFPKFNASLANDGENLILKQYFHIGVAVDTPTGLIVPVVRDADQKGLADLARELADISGRARAGKLKREELQGGCFTISSLGGIGGAHFTPIINLPEVAILGVARAQMKPVWDAATGNFVPRRTLPLALSYDHRVIDGAEGARFITFCADLLGDIRRLAL